MTFAPFSLIIPYMQWPWVIGFGVVGVSARFAIDSWIARFCFTFPIGTLAINLVGCFLAGLIVGFGIQGVAISNELRVGLIVGFCGGFTTFSGFGLQFIQLVNDGRIGPALFYGIASPVFCIAMTALGFLLSRTLS